jgi:hypothetical protein
MTWIAATSLNTSSARPSPPKTQKEKPTTLPGDPCTCAHFQREVDGLPGRGIEPETSEAFAASALTVRPDSLFAVDD